MAATRGVPLAQQLEADPMQQPAGDQFLRADISSYRTGRLAHDEGEPPAVQITQKNLEEVMAWERKLLEKAKVWNLTKLSKYLSQIAATLSIQVDTLIIMPMELLQPIQPYMADLSTEQARSIQLQTILAQTAKHANTLAQEKRIQRGVPLQDSRDPFDVPSFGPIREDIEVRFSDGDGEDEALSRIVDEGDDDEAFGGSDTGGYDSDLAQSAFGKATTRKYRQGGAPIAFPTGAVPSSSTQNRYAHPLTDLSTAMNNPQIRARMELFYKYSNQMAVMSIISDPQFHGDVNLVVKSPFLQGLEQDALSRLTSQSYTNGRFNNAEPHHFYTDDGARRAFAQVVAAVARQNSVINNTATQMATQLANSMMAEAIIKCTACVWTGGNPSHLVLDDGLYAHLTTGSMHTVPNTSPYADGRGWGAPKGAQRSRSIFY